MILFLFYDSNFQMTCFGCIILIPRITVFNWYTSKWYHYRDHIFLCIDDMSVYWTTIWSLLFESVTIRLLPWNLLAYRIVRLAKCFHKFCLNAKISLRMAMLVTIWIKLLCFILFWWIAICHGNSICDLTCTHMSAMPLFWIFGIYMGD